MFEHYVFVSRFQGLWTGLCLIIHSAKRRIHSLPKKVRTDQLLAFNKLHRRFRLKHLGFCRINSRNPPSRYAAIFAPHVVSHSRRFVAFACVLTANLERGECAGPGAGVFHAVEGYRVVPALFQGLEKESMRPASV